MRRSYGLTLAEYDEFRASQGDRCAICSTPLKGGKEEHLDHCHDTGKPRGILCRDCNIGIGLLKDDPSIIQRAALYLTEYL